MSVQTLLKDLPTPKQEVWKFSNLPVALRGLEMVPAPAAWSMTGAFEYLTSGQLDWPHLSSEQPSLWTVNAAYPADGLTIDIPAGKHIERPILLDLQGLAGQLLTSRLHLKIGQGADVTVIETHKGNDVYWKNLATVIEVGANARLRHYRIVEDDPFSVQTQATQVTVRRDGVYEAFNLTFGNKFSRYDINAKLLAENGAVKLSGITLLEGKQFADTTAVIEHEAAHCSSNQLFKTLLNDQSHGVFQGKIHVHQVAQKTDGYQLSNNLLLSPLAEMNVKPELEIYADDVKCSHGTTTGALDETPLFYLRSRGIPENIARRMLIESFLGQVLDSISHDDVRADVEARIKAWLK